MRGPTETDGRTPTERAALLAAVAAGALMPLNTTMIAVALLPIGDHFDVGTGTTGILVTIYLGVSAALQPVAGRSGDRFGYRRVAAMALVAFGVVSVAAAFAPTFGLLLALRAAQAAAGAAVLPNTQALVRLVTPARRQGQAFGLVGSGLGVGAALGPLLGGVLIAVFGWEAIFAVNLPLVGLALLLLYRVPRSAASGAERPVATSGARRPFVASILRIPAFLAACGTQLAVNMALFSVLLVVPAILGAQDWSSAETGLILTSLSFWLIVLSPVGGRLGDVRGRRLPVMVGMSLVTVGAATMAVGSVGIPVAVLVPAVSVCGVGMGISAASLMTAAIESVPTEVTGAAAGLYSMARQIGGVLGAGVVNILVGTEAVGAGTALAVSASMGVVALGLSTRLPGPHRPASAAA